jgi:hypothetical protein
MDVHIAIDGYLGEARGEFSERNEDRSGDMDLVVFRLLAHVDEHRAAVGKGFTRGFGRDLGAL